jgi:hypothetical protein
VPKSGSETESVVTSTATSTAAPQTRDTILAVIGKLQGQLAAAVANARSTVTVPQAAELEALLGDINKDLRDSAVDVLISLVPVQTWNTWFDATLVPKLTTLSTKLNQFADVRMGCCHYDGKHFPSTQDACTEPEQTWTPTPCP